MTNQKFKTEIQRVNGYLKEIVTFFDSTGKPISQIVNPLMVELNLRDVLQLFMGSFLMATPLCFTEEVWTISASLPVINVMLLAFISLMVVTLFIYFHFYKNKMKGNVIQFFKRVIATYVVSVSSVVILLALIDKFPILSETEIAVRRVILIGLPSVFTATISDYLK